jgi:hypothetical protein
MLSMLINFFRPLRNSDVPGSPPAPPVTPPAPSPAPTPAPAPQNDNNKPPAARVVTEGTKSEREIQLEGELQAERERHTKTAGEKIEREKRMMELEDQLRTLTATPKADKKSESKGWGFFGSRNH